MQKALYFPLACLLLLAACSKQNPIPALPEVSIDLPEITLTDQNASQEIRFSTTAPWSLETTESSSSKAGATWVSVSPTRGEAGNYTLTVTIQDNESYDDRSAVIRITTGGLIKEIPVIQMRKGALFLTKSHIELECETGSLAIALKSNIEYQIIIPDSTDWVTRAEPSPTKGLRTDSIHFAITPNHDPDDPRTGQIIFRNASNTQSDTLTIIQNRCIHTITIGDPREMLEKATLNWETQTGKLVTANYRNSGQAMQYLVDKNYTNSPYGAPNATYTEYYSQCYSGPGKNLHQILTYLSTSFSEKDQARYADTRAVASLLKTYLFWQLFDVYGGAVYTEAFQANLGNLTPRYDLLQDTYKLLDQTVRDQVAVLTAPTSPRTKPLGQYDRFYGWSAISLPAGGAIVAPQSDPAAQRARWARFGNVLRIKMAWRLKQRDPGHFRTVMAQAAANPDSLFGSAADGCYYHFPAGEAPAPDQRTPFGDTYLMTDNFLIWLKATGDPRLPLLAEPNDMDMNIPTYAFLATYAPASLNAWGDVTRNGNTYQGQSADASDMKTANQPGRWLGKRQIAITLSSPDGRTPWTLTDQTGSGKASVTVLRADTILYLNAVSSAQGRYWVPTAETASAATLRRNVLTYPEMCLMLAYLSQEDGTSYAGKNAAQWYDEGVRAAVTELQQSAQMALVPIATDPAHHPVAGLTLPYRISDANIDAFLQANPLNSSPDPKATISGQAWVYFYTRPEDMWGWWKLTGYPAVRDIASPADRPTEKAPYFQQPHNTSGTPYEWTRRNTLPQPSLGNQDNYNEIMGKLTADPDYKSAQNLTGRIWWDITGR